MNAVDVRDFSGGDASQEAPKAQKKSGCLAWLGEMVFIVVTALVLSAILRAVVFQIFEIPSGSMENTLQVNDRVFTSKVNDFQRGDIVVFEDHASWLGKSTKQIGPIREGLEFIGVLPSSSTRHLIKRVIGMPGDVVRCCGEDGRLTINGTPLDEPYLFTDVNGLPVAPSDEPFEVTVPAGRLFVMGDHRNASGDSRMHLCDEPVGDMPRGMTAFVPIDHVVGPATAIVTPLNRMQRLRTPTSFDAIPDNNVPAPAAPVITVAGNPC